MKAINNFGFPIKMQLGNMVWGVMPFDGKVYEIPDEFYDKYYPILNVVQMPKPKLSENVDSIDLSLEEIFSEPPKVINVEPEKKPRKMRSASKIAKRNEAAKQIRETGFMSYRTKNKKNTMTEENNGNNIQ